MAEITKSRLKKVDPTEPKDYSNMFRQRRINVPEIEKIKDSLDKPSKPSKPPERGLAPGDRFVVKVKEMGVENTYDNIKYLENKLKDNNLTVSEYRKISDDINPLRMSLLNEQMELEDDKKELEKRIRTYQARSSEDQNK